MASLRVLVEEGILNRGGLIVRGTASGSGLLQTYSRELLVFHNSGRTLGSYRCGVHEFFDDAGSPEPPAHHRRRPGHLDHWGKIFRSDTKTQRPDVRGSSTRSLG
jgi:hypothetical protein